MNKQYIDVQDMLDMMKTKIREMFPDVTVIKQLRGQGRREGWVRLSFPIGEQVDFNVDIEIIKGLTDPNYFKGIFDNMADLRREHLQFRQQETVVSDGSIR